MWPSIAKLKEEQFKLITDKVIEKWKPLTKEEIVDRLIRVQCQIIEENWLEKLAEKIPTREEFKYLHKEVAGEHPYRNEITLWVSFINKLMYIIIERLYYTHKVYTFEELEEVIPYVDDPYFSREYIAYRYMEKMESLKPRGDEWVSKIESLKNLLITNNFLT